MYEPIRGRGRRGLPLSSCENVTNGRRLQSSATSEVYSHINNRRVLVLFSVGSAAGFYLDWNDLYKRKRPFQHSGAVSLN